MKEHMIPEELQPEILLNAYAKGVFPMGMDDGTIGWFAPDPRTIVPLNDYHVPRRLLRTLRQERFKVTIDTGFAEVILCCSQRPEGTWITHEFIEAYTRLHQLGYAHSVESRLDGRLEGGVYGVTIRGAFYAESMFHRRRDASKVALVSLLDHLARRGYQVFDVQFLTEHLQQFGALEISRTTFMRQLDEALRLEHVTFD